MSIDFITVGHNVNLYFRYALYRICQKYKEYEELGREVKQKSLSNLHILLQQEKTLHWTKSTSTSTTMITTWIS